MKVKTLVNCIYTKYLDTPVLKITGRYTRMVTPELTRKKRKRKSYDAG